MVGAIKQALVECKRASPKSPHPFFLGGGGQGILKRARLPPFSAFRGVRWGACSRDQETGTPFSASQRQGSRDMGTKSPHPLPPFGWLAGVGDQEPPSFASLGEGGWQGSGTKSPILCLPRGGRVAGVGDQEPPSSASLGEGGWQGSGTKSPILCLPRGGGWQGSGTKSPPPPPVGEGQSWKPLATTSVPPMGEGQAGGPRPPPLSSPHGIRTELEATGPHLCHSPMGGAQRWGPRGHRPHLCPSPVGGGQSWRPPATTSVHPF